MCSKLAADNQIMTVTRVRRRDASSDWVVFNQSIHQSVDCYMAARRLDYTVRQIIIKNIIHRPVQLSSGVTHETIRDVILTCAQKLT